MTEACLTKIFCRKYVCKLNELIVKFQIYFHDFTHKAGHLDKEDKFIMLAPPIFLYDYKIYSY